MLEITKFDVDNTTDRKSMQISSSDPVCAYTIMLEEHMKQEESLVEYTFLITRVGGTLINSVRGTQKELFLYKCGVRIQQSLNQQASELVWDFLLENL